MIGLVRTHRLLAAGLILGALLRVAALPMAGTGDVGSWKVWSFAASTDPAAVYGVGGTPTERRLLHWRGAALTVDYPPLSIYELGVVGRLYRIVDPTYADSATLTALVKMPGLVTEVLLVVVLLTGGRRWLGDRGARSAALLFWLSPAVLLDGAVLGYLDAQMAVPAVAALLAVTAGQPVLGGALVAAAVLTKAQAVFVVPFVALAAGLHDPDRRGRNVLAFVGGGLAAAACLLAPIVARGAWENMVLALSRLAAHNMVSGNALNVWWFLTWLVRAQAASSELGWWTALTLDVRILQISDWERLYPNPRPVATLLVVAAWLWGLWRARHLTSLAGAALVAGWSVYAYTMLNVQVHENHLYLAVPLLAVAAGADSRLRLVFHVVSAVTAANLYIFYGLGDGWPPLVDRGWTVVDLTVPMSLANLGAFVWVTRHVARRSS